MTDPNMAVMAGPNDQAIAGKKTFTGTLAVATGAAVEGLKPEHVGATAAGKAILTAASAAAQRTALGLGSAAVLNAPASGDAAATEVVKGDDSRLLRGGGEIWVQVEPPSTGQWRSVVYANGKFVAVGSEWAAVMYSADGATWTVPSASTLGWSSVTYGNGRFVAVGNRSGYVMVMHSTDGITWTDVSVPDIATMRSVTYGNGRFVAVGTSSSYHGMYSVDGITWTNIPYSGQAQWNSVTFGNGRFVAVGSDGRAMYSADGAAWTIITVSASANFTSVTFGNGRFVAVGKDGTPRYSDDGVAWMESSVTGFGQWMGVTYGNGRFVAVGIDGETMYSANGAAWVFAPAVAPGNGSWTSVAFGNDRFVAVKSGSASVRAMYSTSSLPASQIGGATAAGMALLTAANASAQRTALGLGTAAVLNAPASGNAGTGEVVKGSDTRLSDARTPTTHSHPASQISDSTAAGRTLLSAADAAAQRTALDVAPAPAHAALTGTAISWDRDGYYWKTISANTTFTFTSLTNARTVVFDLTTVGSVQPTWPTEVKWPGPGPTGITPVHPADGNAVYTFVRINGAVKGAVQYYS